MTKSTLDNQGHTDITYWSLTLSLLSLYFSRPLSFSLSLSLSLSFSLSYYLSFFLFLSLLLSSSLFLSIFLALFFLSGVWITLCSLQFYRFLRRLSHSDARKPNKSPGKLHSNLMNRAVDYIVRFIISRRTFWVLRFCAVFNSTDSYADYHVLMQESRIKARVSCTQT